MKKSRYYPYERNRYFYGKLLTVRDFESEQTYFNDKRRLLNRLLYGSGVVSGLQVIAVDDKSVSVEMGVALDNLGREIVVASPVTLKLSMIEGFTNNEYAKNVYLCLAYDEKGKEPVHSVASSTVRSDEVSEYNRILESYKIFIREEAPDASHFEISSLIEQTSVIYQDAQVRVLQRTPRYVEPNETFEVEILIEKTLQASQITFECELQGDSIGFVQRGKKGKLSFVEGNAGQNTEYRIPYMLKAGGAADSKATVGIKEGSGKLSIGDKQIAIDASAINTVDIIGEPIAERIMKDYFNRTLDQSLSGTPDFIHLAKISLLKVGSTYMIERVDPVPFGEYVYNTSTLYKLGLFNKGETAPDLSASAKLEALDYGEEPSLAVDYNKINGQLDFKLGLPKQRRISDEVTSGYVDIPLQTKFGTNLFAKNEKRYYSDEIEHGLGTGPVFIFTGIEDKVPSKVSDIMQASEKIYLGDQDVFKDSQFESESPHLTVGTVVYPQKGAFRIGIKAVDAPETGRIRIRWWAFRRLPELDQELSQEMDQAEVEAAAGKDEKAKE